MADSGGQIADDPDVFVAADLLWYRVKKIGKPGRLQTATSRRGNPCMPAPTDMIIASDTADSCFYRNDSRMNIRDKKTDTLKI